jgi:hypothetical protein
MELRASLIRLKPQAERWRKLDPPIFDARQTHTDQKFIQWI